jgi:ribosomal-protein-alanine N-acetyltransferase
LVRLYNHTDLPFVLELFKKNCPAYFDISEIGDLREYLQAHEKTYYLFEDNNKILGACGYYLEAKEQGRISWIFTDPESQKKGIGKQLVQHCIKEMQAKHTKSITVWTSDPAYLFFGKLGFAVERIEPNYWAGRFDLYLMTLKENLIEALLSK